MTNYKYNYTEKEGTKTNPSNFGKWYLVIIQRKTKSILYKYCTPVGKFNFS